jgi:site-specific DNA recombinase
METQAKQHQDRGLKVVMRGLDYGRLSRDTDESTSLERQHEKNRGMANVRGDRMVATIDDSEVSGAVSPFERPGLGPYLTEPAKIASWDVLYLAKLDRGTRSLADFVDLVRWLEAHDKYLISVAEAIDLTTAHGRMIANVLVSFAAFERERTGERRAEAAAKLRSLGRWNGGKQVPFGYIAKSGGTGLLYQNPDTAPLARRMALDVIGGINPVRVMEWLNAEGAPTPQGAPRWRINAVFSVLRRRYLTGHMLYQGNVVTDADGNPVMITEDPILKEEEWAQLQAALDRIAKPKRGEHSAPHMLVQVAFCGECDHPMYYQKYYGHDLAYYRCPHKGHVSVRADKLEPVVEFQLLDEYGGDKIMRRSIIMKDYRSELELAERELAELEREYMAHNLSAPRFASMSTQYEARIAELTKLVEAQDEPSWEETHETVTDRWARLDRQERRDMLRGLGISWRVHRVYDVRSHKATVNIQSNWMPVEESHERIAHLLRPLTA